MVLVFDRRMAVMALRGDPTFYKRSTKVLGDYSVFFSCDV